MGRSSAYVDASSAPFDEETTVPAGGRAEERPWNRIHSASEAAQRDLSVNQRMTFDGEIVKIVLNENKPCRKMLRAFILFASS